MRVAVVLAAVLVAGCGSADGTRPPDDPDTLSGDDIERRDLQRIEAMLRGQLAGVRVVPTATGFAIRIRGTNTFMGSADPLFVVDGIPLAPNPEGALEGLNPRDVESIRVLKNVSETAIYGARGANGVVEITTVRPPPPPGRPPGG